jgi:hypothetical protein
MSGKWTSTSKKVAGSQDRIASTVPVFPKAFSSRCSAFCLMMFIFSAIGVVTGLTIQPIFYFTKQHAYAQRIKAETEVIIGQIAVLDTTGY